MSSSIFDPVNHTSFEFTGATLNGFHPPNSMRLLPASVDAEQGCLSSLLLAPVEVGCLFGDLGLTREHFHVPAHAKVFEAIGEMQQRGQAVDIVTLTEALRGKNQLDQVGGPAFVAQLLTFLPTAANAAYYADILKEKAALRSVIRVCTKYAGLAYEHRDEEVKPLLTEIVDTIGAALGDENAKALTPKQLALETLHEIEEAYENKGAPKEVVPTGFTKIDEALGGGLRPDDTILLTGPTKGGKSILAKNICEHVAIEQKRPVLFLSLEMSRKSQAQRVFASQARVNAHRLRSGHLDDRDIQRLASASARYAESKFYIRDDCFQLSHIINACRQFKLRFPDVALFAFDYVQLIDARKERGESRENVVARISTALRRITLELGVAGLLLAQENKEGDARESSRLEQDCTCRIKIHAEGIDPRTREVSIPLARNGPRCGFKLTFLGEIMRFENHANE